MSDDYLIQIDMKTFTDSLNDTIKNLEKMSNRIEKNLVRITYFAGNIIAREMKKNHPWKSRTGSLVRSIHCAPAGADHGNDSDWAGNVEGDLTNSKGKKGLVEGDVISVEIGTWLNYAYALESGKHHEGGTPFPFVLPAFEKKKKNAEDYIIKALNKVLESYSDVDVEGLSEGEMA